MWFVGEFLGVSCCGWRDILWPINKRLASQWEGIQHNFPVGLRRYEPSITTVGEAEADLESLLLMCYVQLCVCLSQFYDWNINIICYCTNGQYVHTFLDCCPQESIQ